MPNNINRVLLVGNLTRDPDLKHTQSGTAVCKLGLAVNGREKVSGEWTDVASFFDVECWGNQAEACAQHLSKGSPVAVDGRLKQDRWEQDGQKRTKVKVVADTVQFLNSGQGGGDQGDRARRADAARAHDDRPSDDRPNDDADPWS